MSHRAPRLLWVGTKVTLAILAYVEPWSRSCDGQVDDTRFVCCRLDCVCGRILVQSNSAAVCVEGKLLIVEVRVVEGIGGPEIWSLAIGIEYLRVELACSMDATNDHGISVPSQETIFRCLTQHYCR